MMIPKHTVLGVLYMSQFCVGVIGNLLLFMLYVYSFLVKTHFRRPIDPIIMHLVIVNFFTILFAMVPFVVSSFEVPNFLDDVGCKTDLYIFRVARGLSICTTSILSTFQAITITPSNSMWARLKPKLSTFTFQCFLLSWIINLFLYIHVTETIIAKINDTETDYRYSHVYCKMTPPAYPNPELFICVIMIADGIFLTIMMWSSLYMVTLLYRHHKRAQHLRCPSFSRQASPEHKATHSILLLVIFFVFTYLLNNLITIYGFYSQTKIPEMEVILATCYPTISPFLLMKNNKLILHFTSSFPVVRMTCSQSVSHG